jgi:type IV pilus assembly protein PilE
MRRNTGFTLIELLIVVAIVGILAAIAIPMYNEQVAKGRRADAVRAVGDLQLALESWRAENPSYADCGAPGCGSGTYPTAPASNFYTITPGGLSATGYTITATPRGVQAGDRCGNLTADQNLRTKPTWSTAACN